MICWGLKCELARMSHKVSQGVNLPVPPTFSSSVSAAPRLKMPSLCCPPCMNVAGSVQLLAAVVLEGLVHLRE